MSLVSIKDLVKIYGNVIAVNGLSLELNEGQIMGLIGPNGSGKTTTLKVLLGLLKPNWGSVEVFGEDPWDNPSLRSRIGVIHERAYFPARYLVLDYLRRVCRIFNVSESRASEILESVGLQPEAYNRSIKALSAGMLQKFALAHALIHEPEFVIADEPTSNLDPHTRSVFLDLIINLHQDQKVTFLISSHILPELSKICQSVAIINKGRIWAQGSLTDLMETYGIGITRVSTDVPEVLAKRIKKLSYVKQVRVQAQGISIDIDQEKIHQLYEDVLRLAKEEGARVTGIESGTASIEELLRLVEDKTKNGRMYYE